MKRILLCVLMLALALPGAAMAQSPWDDSTSVYTQGEIETTDAEKEKGNPIFVITLENGAVMRGELYPDIAPESVGNFIALANSGFYDGLTFHRVIPDFMIQGGDPAGNGSGGPGWNIKGEFSANGVPNDLAHTPGVLSMARAQHPDSAGSQFFLMTSISPHLDGSYAGFGLITEGLDAAYAIVETPRDAMDKPLTPQTIETIRVETFGQAYPFEKLQEQ